jgi:hypothetical protein
MVDRKNDWLLQTFCTCYLKPIKGQESFQNRERPASLAETNGRMNSFCRK